MDCKSFNFLCIRYKFITIFSWHHGLKFFHQQRNTRLYSVQLLILLDWAKSSWFVSAGLLSNAGARYRWSYFFWFSVHRHILLPSLDACNVPQWSRAAGGRHWAVTTDDSTSQPAGAAAHGPWPKGVTTPGPGFKAKLISSTCTLQNYTKTIILINNLFNINLLNFN